MRRLIPVPSIDTVPSELHEGAGPLCRMLDAQFDGWLDEALGIDRLKDPARIPANCLQAAGETFAAGIRPEDGERVRRAKLASAATVNRMRGLWIQSVKPVVEARSGAEAELISGMGGDDFILAGSSDEASGTWSVLGGAAVGEAFGIRIASGSSEASSVDPVPGTVLIDCGSGGLSSQEVLAMVTDLEDLIPAYYKAFVGYFYDGAFVIYPDGEVN